jgi:Holliday junction resolvase RusA-like endonuclease
VKTTLTLPWPPSANKVWRYAGGKPRLSKASRNFRANVDAIVLEAGSPKFDGPVEITTDVYPPDNHERDLDNFDGKALWDALQASCVLRRDSQVKRRVSEIFPPEAPGRLVVTISDREASDG